METVKAGLILFFPTMFSIVVASAPVPTDFFFNIVLLTITEFKKYFCINKKRVFKFVPNGTCENKNFNAKRKIKCSAAKWHHWSPKG